MSFSSFSMEIMLPLKVCWEVFLLLVFPGIIYVEFFFLKCFVECTSEAFFLFSFLFFYLFLAAFGLHCCVRAFSSCGEWGLLFVAVRGLLIVVASLVVEHKF